MNILGIDLSLNATGLAMLTTLESLDNVPDLSHVRMRKYERKDFYDRRNPNASVYQGCVIASSAEVGTLQRWDQVLTPILQWAEHAEAVFIEGYAMSRNLSFTRATTEMGGIVRYHLRKIELIPIEISPSSLKKFVTGDGRADKNQILAAVRTEFDCPLSDHNMADAFGLVEIGRMLYMPEEETFTAPRWQREVIGQIKYGEPGSSKAPNRKLKFEEVSS
jgi:Holliday junction resolvasome RuvABC endonuclease subunit